MGKLYLTNVLSVLVVFLIFGSLSANSPSNRNQHESLGETISNDLRLRELSDQFNTFRDDLTKQLEDFKTDYLIRVVTLETKLEMLTKQMDRSNPMEIVKLVSENQKEICKLEAATDGLKTRIGLVSERQQELEDMNQDFTNLSEVVRQHDIKLQNVSKTLNPERQRIDSEVQQLVQIHIKDNETIWNKIRDITQNISIIHETAVQNNHNLRNFSHVSTQQKQEIATIIENLNQNHAHDNFTLWKNLHKLSVKYDRQDTELQNFAENVTIESKMKVAFTAGISHMKSFSYGQIIDFTDVLTNVGGGLNTSDGVFYCPEPGLYYFFVSIMTNTNEAYVQIDKNDNRVMYISTDYGGTFWKSGSNAVIMQLDRGDRISVKSSGSVKLNQYSTNFSGHRI